MNISACIFDMDGLLIDSESIALSVFQQTCDHYEIGHRISLYQQLLGTNHETTRTILSTELPAHINVQEFTEYWSEHYAERTREGVPLMKGVDNLLSYLETMQIPKAVATSTQTDRAINKLELSGIAHRFSFIIGGDQIVNGKPAPDIYLKAADALSLEPTACLGLEDSPNGVKAALSAGLNVIQIPDTLAPDEALLSLGHTVLDDLDAVVSLLQSHQ